MISNNPRVSIGLPVFNGEEYLEESLDSILAQTYTDFELIISDNASTDHTPRICLKYASKDRRIRYYRNERNLGATRNYNRVFMLSRGKYFKWAADDDVLATNFLSRCVGVLDQDSSIVLCHSKTGLIDERNELVGTYDFKNRIDSRNPHERFGDLISERNRLWVLIFGVVRASTLKKTSLIGNYIGSDRNFLAELGLIGRIYEIPEYLFFRRTHPQSYTERKYKDIQERLSWWTQSDRITFPYLKNCFEYFKSVRRVPLKFSERLLCYAQISKWLFREGWILMGLDVGKNLLEGSRLGHKLDPLIKWIIKLGGIK